MPPLKQEEIVTLGVLAAKGESNCRIGRTLGVTEGTVRYHLQRRAEGAVDGRRNKPRRAEQVSETIRAWMDDQQDRQKAAGSQRPPNLRELHEYLVAECRYDGSYKSVVRFVRGHGPRPKIRPFRRVETPPGAQVQVDWGDWPGVDIGDGPQMLHALAMVLSYSRKEALIWSVRQDQLAWHHCHNEAFRRLGGIAAVARIDNLKTGVGTGAGPWGQVNDAYRTYARTVGFHVDACLPGSPEDKGKIERRIGASRQWLNLSGRHYGSLAELQGYTDELLQQRAARRICPATGTTVEEAWRQEQKYLRPVGILPEVFDVAVTRPVHKDCTVNFEGRTYSVPFVLVDLTVEVRGCATVVQVLHEGRIVAEHPRHTQRLLLIDPAHYEGPGNERVEPPVPLGKMGRRIQQIAQAPVQMRSVEQYARLMEVAR